MYCRCRKHGTCGWNKITIIVSECFYEFLFDMPFMQLLMPI